MSVLTHEEAKKLRDSTCMNDPLALIHATELAVLSKLAAGVSVEPNGYDPLSDQYLYKQDTLQTAIAAARVAALEEAAKVCDRTASDYKGMFAEDESLYIAATDCAKEIRALIGKEST